MWTVKVRKSDENSFVTAYVLSKSSYNKLHITSYNTMVEEH